MARPEDIFGDWEETIIWSCLQGVMGEIYTDASGESAMAILGDFAFYGGNPCEELVRLGPERCGRRFLIMVPQNKAWADLIEKSCRDRAKKVSRYAMKKERDIFDVGRLEQAAGGLPESYTLKLLGEPEYGMCKRSGWAVDLVSQFADYATYKRLGLGVVAMRDGELAAGASSYSRYREGIEIEIDTKEEHRRRGLAYACGAKLILECQKRGLYPSWDAQNLWSVALAEKLGYHVSHAYTAYEVSG